ncbi:NAD(P)H-dependent oxidoreductase [uncultured Abyssibacter sp.]|uniref:FMN-dependent NADH-azoreductase n=1 Tax=uncultured Abyssibacter sp. TaxID=2320202 RepID=UPI0032B1E865
MTQILFLSTSLHSDAASSSQLATQFIEAWQGRHGPATVVHRDLASQPVPHLTADRFAAFAVPADDRTPEQAADVALSDALIAELRAADVLVIALPMYNFGIPSTLKAYIDHVARAGITFRYTENGPVGLLPVRKAFVIATRGGRYVGTPRDTQTPYIREFLNFVGIDAVEFAYAEGMAMGPDGRDAALRSARESIAELAA